MQLSEYAELSEADRAEFLRAAVERAIRREKTRLAWEVGADRCRDRYRRDLETLSYLEREEHS